MTWPGSNHDWPVRRSYSQPCHGLRRISPRAAVVELADTLRSENSEGVAQAQGSALVRAAVEDGEKLTAHVEHADRPPGDVDDPPGHSSPKGPVWGKNRLACETSLAAASTSGRPGDHALAELSSSVSPTRVGSL
jgi:hypothetical protein